VDNPQPVHVPPSPPSDLTTQPITVGDIRDLLVYQRRYAAHQARLKNLNRGEVLAAWHFPSAMPMQRAEHLVALTPPDLPRLTEDAAWSLPTYRRIAETARAAQRPRPDESDLMSLVGSVAERASQTVNDVLKLSEREFAQLLPPSNPATDNACPARIRCDDGDRSVYLDGKRIAGELTHSVYGFFTAIVAAYPDPITFKKMKTQVRVLRGKHPTRDLMDRLPAPLVPLVRSGKEGYSLVLPAPK